ncbi:hypothetical protein BDF20DRAFT_915402 [Mycotypha africana]|uniref:uncharacterized protein n=1 Tax=Mycotypha africana TaxID=64632 RepID=UPI002301ED4A|nr:uncharacterized protein BDF20DRAFT_915402 [Mycotypha africana]KAI8971620.1 hypothetical protein BDF20DRAFT_915402 [Mycotypha africana]
MNGLDPSLKTASIDNNNNNNNNSLKNNCLLLTDIPLFEPQAEDILTDEDLLDLFRIVKQVLRKNPDTERLAKLLFCMSYALGDHIKFSKPCHEDRIVFRDHHSAVYSVRLPSSSSCCNQTDSTTTPTVSSSNALKQGILLNDNTTSSTTAIVPPSSSSAFNYSPNDILKQNNNDTVQKWVDSSASMATSITSPSSISATLRPPSISGPTSNNGTNNTTQLPSAFTSNITNASSLPEIASHPHPLAATATAADSASALRHHSPFRPIYTSTNSTGTDLSAIPSAAAAAAATVPNTFNGRSPSIASTGTSYTTLHQRQLSHHQLPELAEISLLSNTPPPPPPSTSAAGHQRASTPIPTAILPDISNSTTSNSNGRFIIPALSAVPPPIHHHHHHQQHQQQQPSITNTTNEVVMEPQQRGFYYQDGRIAREPVLLQRYAEQGILTQASLMRKRKRQQSVDGTPPYELSNNMPVATKKPKIPHRHGEFEQRRDDIIHRLRTITMADLEQKAQRLPHPFTLAIDDSATIAEDVLRSTVANNTLSREQLGELLEPALRILANHSNMKPHLDNGMNQNGIYYNTDYFRLYLAFEQFQRTFAILFPNEIVQVSPPANAVAVADNEATGKNNSNNDANSETDNNSTTTTNTTSAASSSNAERDKDRERNANMKAYRVWIEPLLTETNWAAFRRNIVVGERMMQLTKSVGQGVLLMTKELSGSKLHLTFTNSEWDEFINGLNSGRWDQTIEWDTEEKKQLEEEQRRRGEQGVPLLVSELRTKFATHYWFYPDGLLVSTKERRMLIHTSTVRSNSVSNSGTAGGNSSSHSHYHRHQNNSHQHYLQQQQQQQQQHHPSLYPQHHSAASSSSSTAHHRLLLHEDNLHRRSQQQYQHQHHQNT